MAHDVCTLTRRLMDAEAAVGAATLLEREPHAALQLHHHLVLFQLQPFSPLEIVAHLVS
jgi:hypothetical protein